MERVHQKDFRTSRLIIREILMVKFLEASTTQHEVELIMVAHSLKKESKELVGKVNLLKTKLSHLPESFICQLYDKRVSHISIFV